MIQPFNLEESSRCVEKKVMQAQAAIRSDFEDSQVKSIKQLLEHHFDSLKGWNLHHDFDLWEQAEAHLARIWPNLRNALKLAMEYGLYAEVRDVFLEASRLLQTAGFVKDRICLTSWLKSEAERREDWATQYLMTSFLAWSYTSCGCYQNLKKANALWNELTLFLAQVGSPTACNEYRDYLRDRQDVYPYNELLIVIYETGVRIAVRCAKFEDVRRYVRQGKDEISVIARSGLISRRLKERFDIAFCYHEGVAYYLMGFYERSQLIFEDTIERGSFIAWSRLVRGAKSWLATIAIEQEEYNLCESILGEIIDSPSPAADKREAICHLIKAQLSGKLGEDVAKAESEKKAKTVLENLSKEQDGRKNYRYDLNAFRLQPQLCS